MHVAPVNHLVLLLHYSRLFVSSVAHVFLLCSAEGVHFLALTAELCGLLVSKGFLDENVVVAPEVQEEENVAVIQERRVQGGRCRHSEIGIEVVGVDH